MNEAIELLRELVDVGLTTSLTSRARALLATRHAPTGADAPAPSEAKPVEWTERWHGSEPQRGYSIYAGRDLIAYIGGDEGMSEAISKIVGAHNKCFDCDGGPCVMNCSGLTSDAAPVPGEEMYTMDQMRDYAEAYARSRKATDAPDPSVTAEAVAVRYQVKFSPVDREPFWADVSTKEYRDAELNGSPVRIVTAPCRGLNCGCTDGHSHSVECLAEHESALGVITDQPVAAVTAKKVELTPMFLANAAACIEHWHDVDPDKRQSIIDKLLRASEEAEALSQRAGTGGDATVTVNRTDLKWLLSMSAGVSRSDAYISLSAAMEAAKS